MKNKRIIQPLALSLLLTASACVSEAEQEKKADTAAQPAAASEAVEEKAAEGQSAVASADEKTQEGDQTKWGESAIAPAGEKKEIPEVVAEIGDHKISRDDLNTELKRQLRGQESQLPEEQLHLLRTKMLEKMIERELLFTAAKKASQLPTEKEIEETIAGIKSQLGSDEAFDQALAGENVSKDEFLAQLKKDLAVNNYLKKGVFASLEVSDAEAETFYKANPDKFSRPAEVNARHILLKVEKDATPEVVAEKEAKAKELLEKAKVQGADFAALARENSECPSAPKGGDLGFFAEGQMVEPFSKAAFALDKGQISDIVRTDFGFHIIKLEDKRDAGTMGMDEVKEQIKSYLVREKQQGVLATEIEKLKADAKVITYMK